MAENRDPKQEPIRLVDEDDRSLTFLNTEADNGDVNTKMNTNEGDLDNPATFEEETAAEYPAVNGMGGARPFAAEERETTDAMNEDDVAAGRGVGTFAIVLSILSLFFLPVLLGAAGIVVGFVSRRYGSTSLGNWAIGIGAISILMTVFFSPFF
ncbi:DUF4190 domain-containing protein [Halalkalibacter urbisdiaboli]|uniref:DUF4190 domain-containing protein n=1 Tax=Halalkalibacter urbisdiaboli TaxID=1960589 RepID=UPI000B447733|nr:DUF4190 domain-containing protein [Halalkalibacter urbisdiaboli]